MFFCNGTKIDSLTTDVTDLGACVVIIRNVPCHKCKQCGETTLSLDVGEQLERIVDGMRDSVTEIAVVQYSNAVA